MREETKKFSPALSGRGHSRETRAYGRLKTQQWTLTMCRPNSSQQTRQEAWKLNPFQNK
ncbi:Hypothetical protein FKW44_001715 [Caligus rogercresseyi]|uniref:Uncharacterized protein n=1 Tax=Caligus rogercresseyi TaxID=217165 RepID=A0A7T8KJ47_CALRO|nr:Hypothetical protein FKW44_001715 [Caligus rogercresseyi]